MTDVTVLTAVRARDQHLLARAYASLLCQDMPWRWLIEVDGPTEEVWEVEDERVQVCSSQRPLGVSAARNLALVAVTTPFVTVLDADDALPVGVLSLALNKLRASGCFAISGALRVVDEETGRVHVRAPRAPAGVYGPDELPSLALEIQRLPSPTQAVTFRADALRAVGGWPGMVLCEDVAAFMLVAQRWSVQIVAEVIYEYHLRQGQSTSARELAKTDLMLRSRILLAQQLQANRALRLSGEHVVAGSTPTY